MKSKLSLKEMITKLFNGSLPMYRKGVATDTFNSYNKVYEKTEKIEHKDERERAKKPGGGKTWFRRNKDNTSASYAVAKGTVVQAITQAPIVISVFKPNNDPMVGVNPWKLLFNMIFARLREAGKLKSLNEFRPPKFESSGPLHNHLKCRTLTICQ